MCCLTFIYSLRFDLYLSSTLPSSSSHNEMSNMLQILTMALSYPILSLFHLGSATRQCVDCVPLQYLTAYACGVSLAVHGM